MISHIEKIKGYHSIEKSCLPSKSPKHEQTSISEKKPQKMVDSSLFYGCITSFFLGLLLLLQFLASETDAVVNVLKTATSTNSFYIIDACASSSLKTKTSCCTDKIFPVLGGLDVVALGQVHKGNPPVLGTLDFPAALPTAAGAYVFLFSSKENQLLFLEDPWRYAPRWGGFDAWDIAQNNALKGDAGKTALGGNADVSHWLMNDGRAMMFGGLSAKKNFLGDSLHWLDKGDERWTAWWGDLKDGPFNTQCLTGLSYTELVEASELYKSGQLPLGPMSVKDRYLESTPRKQLKNAVASARVFTVDPDGTLGSFLVEEGTGQGFGLSSPIFDIFSLPSAVLAVDGDSHPGSLYVADLKNRRVLRVCCASMKVNVVPADLGHPKDMVWSSSDKRLYYTTGGAISWVDDSGLLKGTLYEASGGENIVGIAKDDLHLYYLDNAHNKIMHALLADSAAVPEWKAIESPKETISFIFSWDKGRVLIVTATNTVYKSELNADGSSSTLIKLFEWHETIYTLQVAGLMLYVAVTDRILSAPLAELESLNGKTPEFTEVMTEIGQVPKGMIVKTWAPPNGLAFTASTKYTERGDKPVFNDYPWISGQIVEPFLPATLHVSGPADATVASYSWTFNGNSSPGTEYQVTLEETGAYPIILRELDLDGLVLRELRSNLVCKYVRREIKTLTDEDREAFFDGLEVMVTIPQEEGTRKFGPTFKNNEYFTHMHNVLAGSRDCDHLHQGRGFLTNHMSLTLMFEQSLQLINPALTVPYWDYTVEHADIMKYYGGDLNMLWTTSPIFRPDWFGDAHNDESTVIEGRWAYKLKIPDDQWDNQRHNSYGMMRSPWNNNPSPYVQRFSEFAGMSVFRYNQGWPTCRDHFDLSINYPTFSDYISKMPGWPHGTVHGVLGGTINYDGALDKLEGILLQKDMEQIRLRSPHIPKDMWRRGITECPEYCAADTPMEDCKCTCPQEKMDALDKDNSVFTFYLASALNSRMLDSYKHETLVEGIKVICNAGFVMGDQEESASPADPIFWPIHPTVERLYQWKLLSGGFEDSSWPDEEGNYNSPIYFGSSQRCAGHNPMDRLPWSIILDGKDTPTNYLNMEMMSFIDASGDYQLPYVYDNFEWNHCVEQGYNFDEVGIRSI